MIRRAWRGFILAIACAAPAAGQTTLSPQEALRALTEGNQRFAAGESKSTPLGEGVRRTLSTGQSPFAIIVTCTDSRVPPEHVFNAGLGELFVVRVAGNVCDPETLASIEYAAEQLGAPLCVVMTHDECGVVRAAAEATRATPIMSSLLERLDPAVTRARSEGLSGPDLLARAETENAHETIAECQRRSPVLRELVRLRQLQFAAARYHLGSGEVTWLPTRTADRPRERRGDPVREVQGLPPHLALSMLRAGHRRFLAGSRSSADLSQHRRTRLVRGGRPAAVVLTCSDSRVSPEHVFDSGLGELSVVRVHGNVLSDEALASIELAIRQTGASLVVVMGHRRCDAISAAIDYLDDPRVTASQRHLLQRLEPAIAHAAGEGSSGAELIERAAELNVLRTVAQARTRSSVVRELEQTGALGIVPVTYDLETGDLHWLSGQLAPELSAESYPPAAPLMEGGPDIVFEPPSAVDEHGSSTAAPAASDAPASAAPSMSKLQIEDLLIAFMVATTGVGVLLLLMRRMTGRGGESGATEETYEDFIEDGQEPVPAFAEDGLGLFDEMDDFEDFAEIEDEDDER